MKMSCVGENVCDNGSAGLGVSRELDFDDGKATGGLDGKQVRVPAPERNFTAENDETRRSSERQ